MKGSYKLAAAISLTLLAGNAAAAIETGVGFESTGSATPSSLVFSAVNSIDKQTFVLNLALATTTGVSGLSYADFAGNQPGAHGFSDALTSALAANNGKLTWNLNSYQAFGSFISNIANLRWSVLGGYEKDNIAASNFDKTGAEPEFNGLFTDQQNVQWGALVTAPSVAHLDENNNTALEINPSGTGTTGAYLNALVSTIGAADEASIAPINNVAFYDTKISGWQGSKLPGVLTKNGAGENEFIWATNPFAAGKNQFTSLGKFTLGTDSTLTFTAVPVPASIWMFGSALVGLLGVSRRKLAA